jgi:hypothetical protein
MIRIKFFTLLFLLAIIVADISAQNSQVLYFMDLPQNHIINPALRPTNSIFIGFPVLSGISLNVDNNFVNLSDILMKSRTGDSVISILNQGYNIDKFLSKIKDRVLIEPRFATQLLSLGFSLGSDGYIFADVTERMEGNLVLPSALFQLVLNGNNQFMGKRIDLSSLRGDMKYYREVGLGFSKNLTRKLRIGVKGKLLFGIAGFSIDNGSLGITVDNNYLVKFDADLIVNMSLPVKIALNTDHTLRSFAFDSNRFKTRSGTYNFISGKDNLGLGLDAGATYELTDRLIVSASVTDLGFINWKKNITNLIVKSNFEFGGLDVSDVINGTETFDRLGTDLADSLKKAFHFTRSNNYYKEHLQYNVNLGASYNLNKRISLGLLAYRKIQNNQVNKSLTFSANMNLGNVFSSSLSYNFANYEQNGLGVGMAVRAGMIQLYFLSDRIPLTWNRIKTDKSRSILLPANWNIVDMRLGLNLVFGDQKKKADKPMITYD